MSVLCGTFMQSLRLMIRLLFLAILTAYRIAFKYHQQTPTIKCKTALRTYKCNTSQGEVSQVQKNCDSFARAKKTLTHLHPRDGNSSKILQKKLFLDGRRKKNAPFPNYNLCGKTNNRLVPIH